MLLKKILEEHEGVRSVPYDDATGKPVKGIGKVTVGIGRNLEANPLNYAEIQFLLENDVDEVIRLLNVFLPWWRRLDEIRQVVIADMCFNLGITGLMAFKRTLKSVEDGRFEDAAREMLESLWARQVKRRAIRLANMMRDGTWYVKDW